jgi:predicted ATPase/DNA-binding CsgD family transcriptional regulator
VDSATLSAGDLVGRDEELAAALRLLEDGVRLLTLTGPPGVGKTRLAVEIAEIASRTGQFPDGVVFVDLSSSFDSVGAMTELARSLGVGGASGDRAGPLVSQWLSSRRMLLVLDNAEQVADLAPELPSLLDASAWTHLIVTSRESMHLTREHEFPVPPLQMPGEIDIADLDRMQAVPSVAMFATLARAVTPHFEVDKVNARAIAEICVRLDGLPLALALAAARIKLFTPAQMAARLRDRKALLEATDHDVPARHRTLHAAISWSHAVLTSDERRLFRRLAVFAGPWTLDAAQQVCADEGGDVLELLTSLIDKSLVHRLAADSTEAHFAMLQSVRDFAAEQLVESGDRDPTADRHLRYFAERALAAESRIATSAESTWWEAVSRYEGDTRAARERGLLRGDVDAVLALTAGLGWHWYLGGHFGAAQSVIAETLARLPLDDRADSDAARAFAVVAGIVAWATGELSEAERLLEDARTTCAAAGDERRLAGTLAFLGNVARDRGDYETAAACHRDAGDLYDRLGHDRGSAWARFDLGRVGWQSGQIDAAVGLFREALERFRLLGYPWAVAWSSWALGTLLIETSHESDGGALVASAMSEFELVPDFRGLALCWESLAALAERRSRHAECVRLVAAATAIRTRLQVPRTEAESDRVDRAVEEARAGIGDYETDREQQRGQTMPQADVHELAREIAVGDARADEDIRPGWGALTSREQEVAALVAEGRTNQQIGNRLGIAARTAEAHVHNIMTKLNARSRAEVAVWAVTSPGPPSRRPTPTATS